MREKDLHVVGNPSARVRGEELIRKPSDDRKAYYSKVQKSRGQKALDELRAGVNRQWGHALNAAGWFWIGYAAVLF